jgi:mannose-6-phosphate isomerase-like protein (cupin superfamily)
LDGQRQEFKVGSTFAVPDGKTFTVENTGSEAIQIRVHVIRPE